MRRGVGRTAAVVAALTLTGVAACGGPHTAVAGQWSLRTVVDGTHGSVDVSAVHASLRVDGSQATSYDGCSAGSSRITVTDRTFRTSGQSWTANGCIDKEPLATARTALDEVFGDAPVTYTRQERVLIVTTAHHTLNFVAS